LTVDTNEICGIVSCNAVPFCDAFIADVYEQIYFTNVLIFAAVEHSLVNRQMLIL
jgi:hypothetical protein